MLSDLDEHLYGFMAEMDLDIGETRCGLNHRINYEDNPLAIDYLCQKFSKEGEPDLTIQIPICSECAAALHSEHQILFICMACSSSQWLFRADSNNYYPKDLHILFFKKCPKCS